MKMRSRVSVVALAAVFSVALSACGGGGGGPAPSATTTLSGKLYSGTVNGFSAMAIDAGTKAVTPDTPLAGYQLYCVTFSTPPVAASGTSGADGSVTLTLDVASADLGCFILDGTGTSVATLVFTNGSLSEAGQTISASGAVDLGTITVSKEGVAQATVPSGVTIVTTTPSGASCPDGTWFATGIGHSPDCPAGQDTESTVWIIKKPDGTYAASFTSYNVGINETCAIGSKSGIPLTFASNVATFDEFPFDFAPEDPPCPQKVAHLRVTANADCTTGEISGTVEKCGTCDPAPCNGCGDVTCPLSGTVTRQ